MHLGGWSILKIVETSSLACFFLFLSFMAWFCDCSVIQFWNCKGSHIGPKSLAVIFQSTWSLPWKAHVPKHIIYDSKIMAEYHWIRKKLIRDISVPYSLKSLPSSALFCLVMLWSINRLGPTTSVSWGTHMHADCTRAGYRKVLCGYLITQELCCISCLTYCQGNGYHLKM